MKQPQVSGHVVLGPEAVGDDGHVQLQVSHLYIICTVMVKVWSLGEPLPPALENLISIPLHTLAVIFQKGNF